MKFIDSIEEMREYSQQCKRDGKTIASLNTESYFHKGHMSLVKIAKENDADVVVMCAFHTLWYFQFLNRPERYIEYITTYQTEFLEKDLTICADNGVDVFFQPSMLDFYLNLTNKITLSSPIVDRFIKEKAWLPEMSNGYGDIISMYTLMNLKIFNIVSPDMTIFGEKDIYDSTVYVKSLIDDLNYSIKFILAPTVRDSDGLAYSSRNEFLTPSERQDATSIYQTLHEISRWSTYPSVIEIKEHITNRINQSNGDICYINICCPETIEKLKLIDRKAVILVAAYFGSSYLSDNIIIEP
tara:strand:+ start:47 stop:940 length:894 start_codon:yes stop_codon:yes gene_type:complete